MGKTTLRIMCCSICLLLAPRAALVAQGAPQADKGGPERATSPVRHGDHKVNDGHKGRESHESGSKGSPKSENSSSSDIPNGRSAAVTAPRNALQFGPVGRWWDNKSVIQAIGLRREQQRRMDAIFDANKPAILDRYKGFLKAQADLAAVNKDPQIDKSRVFTAIDAVNDARSSLQKATSEMLLQIRKEMEPNQVDKLGTIP
jgi:Spy/CpxP family protein refolding chaperone